MRNTTVEDNILCELTRGSQTLSLLVRGHPAMINTQHKFVANHTPTLWSDQSRAALHSSDPLQLSGIHLTVISSHSMKHKHTNKEASLHVFSERRHLQAVITWTGVYVPCHWDHHPEEGRCVFLWGRGNINTVTQWPSSALPMEWAGTACKTDTKDRRRQWRTRPHDETISSKEQSANDTHTHAHEVRWHISQRTNKLKRVQCET